MYLLARPAGLTEDRTSIGFVSCTNARGERQPYPCSFKEWTCTDDTSRSPSLRPGDSMCVPKAEEFIYAVKSSLRACIVARRE